MSKKIVAFVMAGGQGSRLKPLTTVRSKPSVPFGARYRIIDFVLSNLVNWGSAPSTCWCSTGPSP